MSCSRLFAPALALLAAGLSPAAVSAQGFEGTVTYAVHPASSNPGQLLYQIKGTKVRTDMSMAGTQGPAASAYMLMDMSTGTMTSVMPAQKMYMTMDFKAMSEQMRQASKAPEHKPAGPPPKITKTGRTETIAGHKCEHYLMGEKQESDICAAKGLGMFMAGQTGHGRGMFGGASLPAGYEQYEEFVKDGFFPLKMSQIKGGKEEVVMQATSIEKKSLDPSLFAVPDGYKELNMGQMMQQMQKQQQSQP
ncbi:MAG TPA: DUF4412 domain-containing protein [Gemmatimonadales bacterium]|nr:DUF4412 domain-containing protein [Gemmatimonadales bacterium]